MDSTRATSPMLRFEGYPAWVRLADLPGDKWAGVVASASAREVVLDLTTPLQLLEPAVVVVEVLDRDQVCRFFTLARPAPDRAGRLLLDAPVVLEPVQRRHSHRAYVSIPVRFWRDGEPEAGARRGHAINLSAAGIGFFTLEPPPAGALIRVRFHHALGGKLGALPGEVVRVAVEAEQWHNVAVRLGSLPAEQCVELRTFVDGERWLSAGQVV